MGICLVGWPRSLHYRPLICSTNEAVSIKIMGKNILNSKNTKLLGINFDYGLSFKCHINEICKEDIQTLNELSKITPYMKFAKR